MTNVNPSFDELMELRDTVPEGPIVMANLIKFKSPDKQSYFAENIGPVIGPLLGKLGAEVVYSGTAVKELIHGDNWDMTVLVKFPSFQTFIDLNSDPDWKAKGPALRQECFADTRMVLTSATAFFSD